MPTPPTAKRMRLASKTPLVKICEELKISPKYLNEETRNRTEQMSLQAIEEKVALDDFGNAWPNRDHKAVLIFLYGRQFYDDETPEKRRNTIGAILKSATATNRILRIAAKDGDKNLLLEEDHGEKQQHVAPPVEGMPMRTTSENPYSLWMASAEDWAQPEGAVTITSKFGIQMVLRQQLSANCFIHAPDVLQGYLVQKGTRSFRGMIDLTKFIRDCVEDDLLASLVLTDDGGTSFSVLATLLPDSLLICVCLRDPQTIPEQQKEDDIKKDCRRLRESWTSIDLRVQP